MVFGEGGFAGVAAKSWSLAPVEVEASPAALYLPEELTRITGYSSHTTPANELGRIVPHRRVRRASTVHEIHDAALCGGDLYKGPYKHMMRGGRRRLLARVDAEVDDAGVIGSTWLGGHYFGHWLGEDVSIKLLAAEYGGSSEIDYPQTAHQTAYNALFGIERRVVPDYAAVRRLTLIDTDLCSSVRDRGWDTMAARIGAVYGTTPHPGCMLLRGASGLQRVLVNEAEIAERLRRRGFRIVDPQTATLDEILRAVAGSEVVAGVEGSQLAHGFHGLASGGAMLVLQPPYRFGCTDKDRCDRKGALYAFCIGLPVADGFTVEPDAVEGMLDRIVARRPR